MSELNLHLLATASTKEERSDISHDVLRVVRTANFNAMKKALDQELYAATLSALQYTDSYWDYVSYLQSEKSDGEKNNYFSVRVRLDEKRNSLGITWQKRYPIKGGGKSGRTSNSRHISKGASSNFRYAKTAFGQIKDWEYSAIEEAEKHFEQIRRQVDAIGKLRRGIDALERLVEKSFSPL